MMWMLVIGHLSLRHTFNVQLSRELGKSQATND